MKCSLFPDIMYESAYHVDYEGLWKEGIRGLVFDIDNTLTGHGAPADQRSVELLNRLSGMGFALCILSNNKRPRVESFCAPTGTPFISKGGKPSRKGYRKAMDLMGTRESESAFIGDQIFTDIWGAKRAGMKAVLVKPLYPKEEIQIVLKRLLEKPVIWMYGLFSDNLKP